MLDDLSRVFHQEEVYGLLNYFFNRPEENFSHEIINIGRGKDTEQFWEIRDHTTSGEQKNDNCQTVSVCNEA